MRRVGTMTIFTKRELHALMFAQADKEPSRALPKQAYFDPAASVMFESERKAKAEAKAKRRR